MEQDKAAVTRQLLKSTASRRNDRTSNGALTYKADGHCGIVQADQHCKRFKDLTK
jgi:hypothetical protein